jgi:hypothetical protein
VIPDSVTSIGVEAFYHCKCDESKYQPGVEMCNCKVGRPACIEDGCVKGDITKKHAKKHCCHGGHETLKCKGTHWRCDPPTAEIRGRAFEFTQV